MGATPNAMSKSKDTQLAVGAIGHIESGIALLDHQQRIVVWNKWLERMSGIAAECAHQEHLSDLFPIVKGSRFENAIQAALEFKLPSFLSRSLNRSVLPLTNPAADGDDQPHILDQEVYIKPIQDESGENYALVQIFDVTADAMREKKLRQQTIEMKDLMQEAHLANKMKSEFLAVMSHEIRTPMNGVLGMARALESTSLTDGQREKLSIITESAVSLLDILNDVLDLSKVESGHMTLEDAPLDLHSFLMTSHRSWAPRFAEKKIQFTINLPQPFYTELLGDSTRIRQILWNLLSNALKFTEEGSVDVDVTQAHLDDGRVETNFAVTDTGIGIDDDALSGLFEKFTQADSSITRRYGGTGLGLAICKEFANLMDGDIGAESVPGKGSTFWFTMKNDACGERQTSHAIGNDVCVQNQLKDLAKKRKILVAEDNVVNQKVISAILSIVDIQADFVPNGFEALEAVMQNTYDLILMDIQMPVMDGLAATERLRTFSEPKCNTPIVALTANAMKGDRARYLAAGMTDYISKPIQPESLYGVLWRYLSGAQEDVA